MKESNLPPHSNNSDQETGSSKSGEPVFLAVGKLRRPHGVNGEFLMDVLTDFPDRLTVGKRIFMGEAHEPLQISTIRWQNKAMLVTFQGLDDLDAVGRLRNKIIYINADDLPKLPEGEYYHHQLLGLHVLDENDTSLGFLTEILETGANDVYVVVSPDGVEHLLPAIADVILEVNLERRDLRVRTQEYL